LVTTSRASNESHSTPSTWKVPAPLLAIQTLRLVHLLALRCSTGVNMSRPLLSITDRNIDSTTPGTMTAFRQIRSNSLKWTPKLKFHFIPNACQARRVCSSSYSTDPVSGYARRARPRFAGAQKLLIRFGRTFGPSPPDQIPPSPPDNTVVERSLLHRIGIGAQSRRGRLPHPSRRGRRSPRRATIYMDIHLRYTAPIAAKLLDTCRGCYRGSSTNSVT